ncbi:MAG: 3-isopropylmalate dehydratase [Planctomycetes bacterium SM23_65]|nr:MAG: 3-isopropylmalate dehydratase [Planctomycetes bacterium SM23_65]
MTGRALKYGADVNTDVIIPSRYLSLVDPHELGKHAMEGLDSDFAVKVKEHDVLVAGRNFGCGSSREQAPLALKYAGVKCVLADSFARIFFRNAINIGLPVMECEGIHANVKEGDVLSVDPAKGVVRNHRTGIAWNVPPVPEFLLEIMEKGLVQYVKDRRDRR